VLPLAVFLFSFKVRLRHSRRQAVLLLAYYLLHWFFNQEGFFMASLPGALAFVLLGYRLVFDATAVQRLFST
jgi:hypothetical protein